MGAWGTGTFDDDSACDWLDDLEQSQTPVAFLEESLAAGDGYLEYDQCHAIICASEMIHSLAIQPRPGLPDEARAWLSANRDLEVSPLCATAASALGRVLGEASELNELWQENEAEYPTWCTGIESLRTALQAAA